jgi:hypothetical protein
LSNADDPDSNNDSLVTRLPISLLVVSDDFESGDTAAWSAAVP